MRILLYRILRFLLKGMLSLLSVIILYLVVAITCSAIPVNTHQPEKGEITIYLRSNGIHTDFVFPLQNEVMDWTKISDPTSTLSKRADFQYVSFGWGDLEFYEQTPKWSDLRFPVAFQAVFLRKPSAMHVEFLNSLGYASQTVPVKVTKSQYRKLTKFVAGSFKKDDYGKVKPVTGLHYNQNDVFYPAQRSLNFFYTCNTWVNSGLKKAGVRACLWTPFDEGIFFQYR